MHGDRKISTVGDTNMSSELKFDKLKPWLRNAEQNVTHSKKILSQMARIKVLDVRYEKFQVNRK